MIPKHLALMLMSGTFGSSGNDGVPNIPQDWSLTIIYSLALYLGHPFCVWVWRCLPLWRGYGQHILSPADRAEHRIVQVEHSSDLALQDCFLK